MMMRRRRRRSRIMMRMWGDSVHMSLEPVFRIRRIFDDPNPTIWLD
jgi:hypothetical protein